MRELSWWEMVAQLNEESIDYVVEDGVLGHGLVGCDIRPRRNSYDHQRQVRNPDVPQLRAWDYVLNRSDGTAVRLHPQWSSEKVKIYPAEGIQNPSAPLQGA